MCAEERGRRRWWTEGDGGRGGEEQHALLRGAHSRGDSDRQSARVRESPQTTFRVVCCSARSPIRTRLLRLAKRSHRKRSKDTSVAVTREEFSCPSLLLYLSSFLFFFSHSSSSSLSLSRPRHRFVDSRGYDFIVGSMRHAETATRDFLPFVVVLAAVGRSRSSSQPSSSTDVASRIVGSSVVATGRTTDRIHWLTCDRAVIELLLAGRVKRAAIRREIRDRLNHRRTIVGDAA